MERIYKLGTLAELVSQLDGSKEVYLDTETSKLGSQIRLVQVYQSHWDKVLLFDTADGPSATVLWTVLQPHYLILANGLYDFGCFKKDMPKGEFKMPDRWEDTFYLDRLVNAHRGNGNYSLDKGLTYVLGYDPYARHGLDKKRLQMSFERIKVKDEYVEGPEGLRPLTEEQYLYAAIDVYELPKLYETLAHYKDDFVYVLDKLCAEDIMTDEKGMPLDFAELTKLEQKDISLIAEIDKKLPIGFNVNSYQQVRKLLNTKLSSDEEALTIMINRSGGLEGLSMRLKPSGKNWAKAVFTSLDEKSISVETRSFGDVKPVTSSQQMQGIKAKELVYYKELNYKHSDQIIEYAKAINDKRKALKRLNFVKRAREAVDAEGRIKGTFSPHAINGRIQVDNENLSQYPRSMKRMWGHPEGNGRKLIYSDFAQVELRIICAALPEMNMYKSLKDGVDLHTFVGNNLNLSDEDMAKLPNGINPRFIAKQCNFLLLYGGGISNFQRTVCKLGGVWFEDDIAKKIVNTWKEIFSDITEWHKVNARSKTNMDETVTGRRYKADSVMELNNIRVSGTGSEIFKLWLHYIWKKVVSQFDDVYTVNRTHDSTIIDVPDDPKVYKTISHMVAILAQKAWFEIIKNAPLKDVPMPVNVAVGSNWEDIEYEQNLDYSFDLEGMEMYDKTIEEGFDEFGYSELDS
jgi:DNA polymerase I-like protein with 3'-5' exonuclease and polymerase domains